MCREDGRYLAADNVEDLFEESALSHRETKPRNLNLEPDPSHALALAKRGNKERLDGVHPVLGLVEHL